MTEIQAYRAQARILKECRLAAGLNQSQLGERLSVSSSTISRWEKYGCKNWFMVCRLARALGQDLNVFKTC